MDYDFYKYHALGNDYIVIDPNNANIKKKNLDLNKESIKLICDRHFGIGSDGILYGPFFDENKINLRILNPDGSEAEKSGNGIRIFSYYLTDKKYVLDNKFEISTLGGIVKVEILDKKTGKIKVDMGKASFKSSEIPVSGKNREVVNEPLKLGSENLRITCVSIGNPHCVIPMNQISKKKAVALGPKIENNKIFPNRINMQIMKVIDSKNIQIEIWERGAGYTLASGSSSCAAACAAFRLGLIERSVNVHMPGGIIEIKIDEDWSVHMTGTVSSVFYGNFSQSLWDLIKK